MNRKNLSLWEIKKEHHQLLSQLYDYETGEINEEADRQLKSLAITTEEKCIALTNWIKKLEAERNQIAYMKKEILEREAAYDNEIAKRLSYLKSSMEGMGINEIKCPYFTLHIKKNPYGTEILDESQVPPEFMRTRQIIKSETKPDKNAIKEKVLATGLQVAGARVSQKKELKISLTKI